MTQDGQQQEILVVDDMPASARLLSDALAGHGYTVRVADDGAAALVEIERRVPDLVLLDYLMPGLDGIEVCRRLRADARFSMLPIVMVTALDEREHRIRALEVGADDFLSKPVDRAELRARVRSLLRIKRLYDTVQRQAAELAGFNAQLEARVAEAVAKVEQLSRLKRFFSPRLAETLLKRGDDALSSHRREIVVVFLDLRGYTGFAETVAPEEVMRALAQYHEAMGKLVLEFDGTLERFTGDGMMVFFNDPLPIADAPERALTMALAMQTSAEQLRSEWRVRGFDLGLGIGVSQGYATLGKIGFEGRIDYGAIGAVTNLAHRLCATAAPGEVLAARRVLSGIETRFEFASRGPTMLPGFARATDVVQVRSLRPQ